MVLKGNMAQAVRKRSMILKVNMAQKAHMEVAIIRVKNIRKKQIKPTKSISLMKLKESRNVKLTCLLWHLTKILQHQKTQIVALS